MKRPPIPETALAAAAGVLLAASTGGLLWSGGTDHDASPREVGADIAIVDFRFEPEAFETVAGQPVSWTNDDGVAHTVTSAGGGPLRSGDIAPGGTYEATLAEPGTYDYICTIHPTMRGTVEVTG